MPTLTRQNMLDIIAAGGVVGLWPGVVLRTAGEVPTQAALDSGQYDSPAAFPGTATGTSAPSGSWIVPLGTPGTFAMGAGNLQVMPLWIPRQVSITEILGEVTVGAASSFIRMGIYRDNGSGYPGALVTGSDSGQIDASAAALKPFTYGTPVVLSAGTYWVGGVNQGGTPTVRSSAGNNPSIAAGSQATAMQSTQFAYFQGGVTGALPSTFTTTLVSSTIAHRVALKVA